MNLDSSTIEKINSLKILDVADKLQLGYSAKGGWRKALCFCHDDHHPSLGINPSRNTWKCFSCGKGGSHIDLVMEHENLAFPDACEWLIREFNIPVPQKEIRKSLIEAIKEKVMKNENEYERGADVSKYLSPELLTDFKGVSNEFTRALVSTGILTQEQMNHAAETFRLSTADDSVIFWQIDSEGNIREGKVMYYQADGHRSHSRKPVTVSWLLKEAKKIPKDWQASRCLFGLHQTSYENEDENGDENENRIIAVVESEKTAVICSELIPRLSEAEVIWLATGGKSNLSAQALLPLKGMRVILFPDTDAYTDWVKTAQEITEQFGHPITVSNILEQYATADQKKRKIDLADFIIESR